MTQMNVYLRNRSRLMDVENNLGSCQGGGGWGRVGWEAGVSRRRLLCRQ